MPRKPRLYIPDIPTHIVQRGNNRNACFFAEEDFHFYKHVMAEGLKRYGAKLHAYCLMTNHVHLLISPLAADSISRVMQHIGRHYVNYINKAYQRSGTLWEGRHKSSLIDADNYLLTCYRYIELNPVAANMVQKPEEYPWSSYRANAIGEVDPLVTPHKLYLELDNDPTARCHHYRELFCQHLTDDDVHKIRECLCANYVLGEGRFKTQVEALLNKKMGYLRPGRPAAKSGSQPNN